MKMTNFNNSDNSDNSLEKSVQEYVRPRAKLNIQDLFKHLENQGFITTLDSENKVIGILEKKHFKKSQARNKSQYMRLERSVLEVAYECQANLLETVLLYFANDIKQKDEDIKKLKTSNEQKDEQIQMFRDFLTTMTK
jgi:hypothetical protein